MVQFDKGSSAVQVANSLDFLCCVEGMRGRALDRLGKRKTKTKDECSDLLRPDLLTNEILSEDFGVLVRYDAF